MWSLNVKWVILAAQIITSLIFYISKMFCQRHDRLSTSFVNKKKGLITQPLEAFSSLHEKTMKNMIGTSQKLPLIPWDTSWAFFHFYFPLLSTNERTVHCYSVTDWWRRKLQEVAWGVLIMLILRSCLCNLVYHKFNRSSIRYWYQKKF